MVERVEDTAEQAVIEPKSGDRRNTYEDEALKVLEKHSSLETWTSEDEQRLRRRVDWKLMPILCMTFAFQYYDKALLSQAVGLST